MNTAARIGPSFTYLPSLAAAPDRSRQRSPRAGYPARSRCPSRRCRPGPARSVRARPAQRRPRTASCRITPRTVCVRRLERVSDSLTVKPSSRERRARALQKLRGRKAPLEAEHCGVAMSHWSRGSPGSQADRAVRCMPGQCAHRSKICKIQLQAAGRCARAYRFRDGHECS